ICWLSGGWPIPSRCAARVKCRSSATARKYRKWRSSISSTDECIGFIYWTNDIPALTILQSTAFSAPFLTSAMPTVTRPNAPSLHYSIFDCTDPWGDAPYLFLQHGYGRNGGFWYQWIPQLCRQFRVVCPDLRGHGQSGRQFDLDSGFTLETLSDDVI